MRYTMKETLARLPELKQEHRQQAEFILSGIPQSSLDRGNISIYKTLAKLPEFRRCDFVFTYVSIEGEPDTLRIIEYSLKLGKRVAVPVCRPGRRLDFFEINSVSELCFKDKYGIPIPDTSAYPVIAGQNTLAVVPGVRFTRGCIRLGRGAGFYDGFLSAFPGFSVGLCRNALLCDELPFEAHDIPVCAVATENRVYRNK